MASSETYEEFLAACRKGDLAEVMRYTRSQPDGEAGEDLSAGLILACTGHTGHHDEIVHKLLEHGASVDHVDAEGRTPLIVASLCFHATVIKELLRYSPALDVKDHQGRTALMYACAVGSLPCAEFLLRAGCDVEEEDEEGRTALDFAFAAGQEELLRLVAASCELNRRSAARGCGFLHRLIRANPAQYNPLILLLLPSRGGGLDVNLPDLSGLTPVHLAASAGNNYLLHELLMAGGDARAVSSDKRTPLHVVCAGPGLADTDGGEEDGEDEEEEEEEQVPSVNCSHVACLKMLLLNGADVNARDARGRTPLYLAASRDRSDHARFLLGHRAEVDTAQNAGFTPLMACCVRGHEETGRLLLLEHAPDIHVSNRAGRSALHMACFSGGAPLVDILLTRGAQHSTTASDGVTPLMCASLKGFSSIVSQLLHQGAAVNTQDKSGKSALHLACLAADWTRAKGVVRLLLDFGARPNLPDTEGVTALNIAQRKHKVDLNQLFNEYEDPEPAHASSSTGAVPPPPVLLPRVKTTSPARSTVLLRRWEGVTEAEKVTETPPVPPRHKHTPPQCLKML